MLARRRLGRTEQQVSLIGLGGNGLMRTQGHRPEAVRVVQRAIDLGITYFDAAPAYEGCEDYLGAGLQGHRDEVFLASKSAQRTRAGVLDDLDNTLRRLKTDHLDLWEVHDLRTREELEQIQEPDGALAGFDQARRDGKVRFIGITAHHDPLVLRRAVEIFPFETCMLPVNLAEPHYRSFPDEVFTLAKRTDMGLVAMKAFCGGLIGSPEPALRYVLSQAISTVLIGVDSLAQLEQNVDIAEKFKPMSVDEMQELLEACRPEAMRLMYYKRKLEIYFSMN